MISRAYKFLASYREVPHIMNFTIGNTLKWSPDLACWGVSALVGVLFFADSIPRLHRDFFQKIPIVGPAYDKSVPASDAPF